MRIRIGAQFSPITAPTSPTRNSTIPIRTTTTGTTVQERDVFLTEKTLTDLQLKQPEHGEAEGLQRHVPIMPLIRRTGAPGRPTIVVVEPVPPQTLMEAIMDVTELVAARPQSRWRGAND